MNRSESDPPSGEEEEEIQSSSSDPELDWLTSISKQDHVEYSEALDACTTGFFTPTRRLQNNVSLLLDKRIKF